MIQFRISRAYWAQIKKLVDEANSRSEEELGVPGSHTVASLARYWVEQRLQNGGQPTNGEGEPRTLTRHAPNVLEASERLRGVRR